MANNKIVSKTYSLDTHSFSRRQLLSAAVGVPLAAGLLSRAEPLYAKETPSNAIRHSFALGDFTVSTLLAGSRTVSNPHQIFGLNVDEDEFAKVSQSHFIPTDRAQFYFTPTVIQTGDQTVLFDTGLNAGGIAAALEAAGLSTDAIDVVVITHMHGDHIGGLTDENGAPTFANARYVTGQVEYDAWAKMDNEGFDSKVRPLAEKMSFVADGDSVVGGVSAVSAFGHTPGHMDYMLESAGQQLLVAADTANHYVWSLAFPDWEVKFDMDKAKAAESRRKIFGMLAADRIPFIGYHMPFPGLGFVDTRAEGGFHYVPASYQFEVM